MCNTSPTEKQSKLSRDILKCSWEVQMNMAVMLADGHTIYQGQNDLKAQGSNHLQVCVECVHVFIAIALEWNVHLLGIKAL